MHNCSITPPRIKTCMPTHAYFSIFHNSCCRDKSSTSLMAHGNIFLLPFGQRKRLWRLMRKRRMPISAKFVAKGTPSNAPHATFICVQVACINILVRLMFLSSPQYIFMCSLAQWTILFAIFSFGQMRCLNFTPPCAPLRMDHACFCS